MNKKILLTICGLIIMVLASGTSWLFLKDGQIAKAAGEPITLNINAQQELRDIYPTAIGGDETLNLSSDLWTVHDYAKGNNLKNMSWRIFMYDDSSGWRWDKQTIEPTASEFTWCELGLDGCHSTYVAPDGFYAASYDDVVDYNQGNKFVVDYWGDATDMSHSAIIVKTTAAANSAKRMIFPASNPVYARFDIRIDSERSFRSVNSGWQLLGSNNAIKVYLTDDRRFDVRCSNSGGPIRQLALSEPMALDQYYSFEIKYGQGECAYWVNNVEIDRQTLNPNTFDRIYLGSYQSSVDGAEGQLHLDAIRIDNAYIGANVQYPWRHNYLYYLTFDNNVRTIDDIASIAEDLGTTVIWQIPVPNKSHPSYVENQSGSGWSWMTKQYYADMAEYLNGVADADFATKVLALDYNHQTPNDNWANLRAYRGRVQPYNQFYFEFGNEPYYGGHWSGYEMAYANLFNEYAAALKTVDSRIKMGHHIFGSSVISDAWYDQMLPITKNQVDFISIYHHYNFTNSPRDNIIQWLGVPVSDNNTGQYYMGRKGPWDNDASYSAEERAHAGDMYYEPYLARYKIKQYIPERANEIFLATTEYGYFLQPGYGEENWLGSAINRAGWVGAHVTAGVKMANVWTLFASRFGRGMLNSHSVQAVQNSGSAYRDLVEVTPSYYVYRLWADHFGSKLVGSNLSGGLPPYRKTNADASYLANTFDYPYASAWASLNASKNKLYVMFINRQETDSVAVTINLNNFIPSGLARVYTVNGENPCSDNEITNEGSNLPWWCPVSDGVDNPNQIIIQESSASVSGNSLTYSFPKLSVTAIEMDGTFVAGPDTTPPITSISPAGGVYSTAQSVSLTANETAAIHYCLGASCTPTLTYSSPISVSTSTSLRYYAVDTASNAESVKTAVYTITPICTESWSYSAWSTCAGGTQTRTATDANSCGTTASRQPLSQSCVPTCVENWTYSAWSTCVNSTQTRTATDSNGCGTTATRLPLSQSCVPTCVENWTYSAWSTCVNSTQTRTATDSNGCGTTATRLPLSQGCTVACSPNWVCSANWSTCTGDTQTRICTDSNNCGITTGRPATSQACSATSIAANTAIVVATTTTTATTITTTVIATTTKIKVVENYFKGRLVKLVRNPAIYLIDGSNIKHFFVNAATFWTWYSGGWAKQVVTTIAQSDFDNLRFGENVTARPGVNLIKFKNSRKVYAIMPGKRLCEASSLYGTDWQTKAIVVSDFFAPNYTLETKCKVVDRYPDGSLIQYQGSSDIWYIDGGLKRKVTPTVFTANKFKPEVIIKNVSPSMFYHTSTNLEAW